MIQVYTGDGKGKTTAAIGQAVRAAGRGFRVVLIQFFKESEKGCGDSETINKLGLSITPRLFGRDMLDPDGVAAKDEIAAKLAEGLALAREVIGDTKTDMLVLDEISHAVNLGLLSEEEVTRILDDAPEELEIVLTGSDMPSAIIDRADLVTQMKKLRHPHDKGIRARDGIEY